jgi:hypothetical protein
VKFKTYFIHFNFDNSAKYVKVTKKYFEKLTESSHKMDQQFLGMHYCLSDRQLNKEAQHGSVMLFSW